MFTKTVMGKIVVQELSISYKGTFFAIWIQSTLPWVSIEVSQLSGDASESHAAALTCEDSLEAERC